MTETRAHVVDYHRQRAIIISSTTTVDRSVYPYKSAEAIETAKERKFALFAADRLKYIPQPLPRSSRGKLPGSAAALKRFSGSAILKFALLRSIPSSVRVDPVRLSHRVQKKRPPCKCLASFLASAWKPAELHSLSMLSRQSFHPYASLGTLYSSSLRRRTWRHKFNSGM